MTTDKAVKIPVPLRSASERRGAERFVAAMPVSVDGGAGTTQDLSANGLSFLTEHSYEVGARIDVVIEYLLDGHNYPLACVAEVVRVEPAPEGFRIGARLAPQSQLQDVPAPGDGPGAEAWRQHLRSIG
jgi:hypothetical protein